VTNGDIVCWCEGWELLGATGQEHSEDSGGATNLGKVRAHN